MYGGFEGDEYSRTERNPATYVTTLSGNIGNAAASTDNSYHVVTASSISDATLDGFTIRDGRADGGGPTGSNGGGNEIYNDVAMPLVNYSIIQGGDSGIGGSGGTAWSLGTDNLDQDPVLQPLASNDGNTQTMALEHGSAAINAGDDAACAVSPANVDQRGIARPQGPRCDIGAFELEITRFPPADFDSLGDTDIGVLRPSDHNWYVKDLFTVAWHVTGDIPVSGDFDGDHDTDVAVYRPSNGKWFVRNQFSVCWGIPGDIPVPGDYDGDGDIGIAQWRPSDGKRYVKNEFIQAWGANGDWPLIAPDTNADGDPYQ